MVIENFGLFRGKHILDLRPDQSNGNSKPIILIGGKNGVGKTTIFEAIRLCLYGQGMDGFQLRRGIYEKYIEEHIHQILGLPIQLNSALVEIEIEYSHLGKTDTYTISRKWERKKSKINESLTVQKNGIPLPDIDPSDYQNYINELIPPGISRLFFFDGEKIQDLAEDTHNNIHLKDSFKSLLGIHLVEQLNMDLNIYKNRISKDIHSKNTSSDYLTVCQQISEIENTIQVKQQERAQKFSINQQVLGEIDRLENLIAREGGSFANKREELKILRARLEKEIEYERNYMRELISNLFPFAIVPKYCLKLKERIYKEESYQQWKMAEIIYKKRMEKIEKAIEESNFWTEVTINDADKNQIKRRISSVLQSSFSLPQKYENFTLIHQLSPPDQRKILQGIDSALDQVPDQIKKSSQKLENLTKERQRIERMLNMAPEDDVILPYILELKEKNREQGQIEEQIKMIDQELHQLELKKTELQRKRDLNERQQKMIDTKNHQIQLVNRIQDVLKEFIIELQNAKIQELSQQFLSCFNRLLRKRNTIKGIDIDLNNFSIVLQGKGEGKIPKEKLSVGEKQIYAIAMLWALTIVSERPIPFIIDTPLGRLDSDHRSNLISEFFPKASHQLIILSTDTEIDLQFFNDLESFISKSYHLEYNEEEGMTTINSGYFWKTDSREAIV